MADNTRDDIEPSWRDRGEVDTHMDQQHKHLQYNVLQQCGHTHGPAAETLVDLPTTQTCATTMWYKQTKQDIKKNTQTQVAVHTTMGTNSHMDQQHKQLLIYE